MKRPTVTTRCVADSFHAPNERMVEFSGPAGNGGLISLAAMPDGTLSVHIYRYDTNVRITVGQPVEGK